MGMMSIHYDLEGFMRFRQISVPGSKMGTIPMMMMIDYIIYTTLSSLARYTGG